MAEHQHKLFAVLVASIVRGRPQRKGAVRDVVSEVAHQLKSEGRQLFGAVIDASDGGTMLRLVAVEEADEVAAMVLEVPRSCCCSLSFEQIIKQRHRTYAAGALSILLGYAFSD